MNPKDSYARIWRYGRLEPVPEGYRSEAPCGCVSQVMDGHWRVVRVCEGGRRQGVQTYVPNHA